MVSVVVFIVAAAIILGGGLGVVLNSNPVRAALSLIASFFGVAVLFVQQEAHFLAFVQVVVYAGAIVVLFLFVIMLLGVDTAEDLRVEPLVGQRAAGVVVGMAVLGLVLGGLFLSGPGFSPESGKDPGAVALTGTKTRTGPLASGETADAARRAEAERAAAEGEEPVRGDEDVTILAADLFGRQVLAFEATALLLTIATVGAVVLVKNRGGEVATVDEPGTAAR